MTNGAVFSGLEPSTAKALRLHWGARIPDRTQPTVANRGASDINWQGGHALALEAREYLLKGQVDQFGALLHRAWQLEKRFAPGVTTERIDRCYGIARQNGALGGKIAGAGGGRFLMLYCDDGASPRVEAALARYGLRRMDFRFEADGPRVLFNAGLRLR